MQRVYDTPKISRQVFKFAFVGTLNTALDFAVLNLLIFLFGIDTLRYSVFKTVAFLVALGNSYLWNKYWVFGASRSKAVARERIMFVLMSLVGLGVNTLVSSVAYGIAVSPAVGLSAVIAANIGAVLGVVTVMALNFLSYKFLVFMPV